MTTSGYFLIQTSREGLEVVREADACSNLLWLKVCSLACVLSVRDSMLEGVLCLCLCAFSGSKDDREGISCLLSALCLYHCVGLFLKILVDVQEDLYVPLALEGSLCHLGCLGKLRSNSECALNVCLVAEGLPACH